MAGFGQFVPAFPFMRTSVALNPVSPPTLDSSFPHDHSGLYAADRNDHLPLFDLREIFIQPVLVHHKHPA